VLAATPTDDENPHAAEINLSGRWAHIGACAALSDR
jgi:hypothetical protein